MKVLLIVEHDNKTLKDINYHTLTAAKQLGDVDALIIGHNCDSVVTTASSTLAVNTLFVANAKEYQHQLAENSAELIKEMAKGYHYIVAGASTFGKNVLPRAAALLDVGMLSDILQIVSHDEFVRPLYAGNALATVQSLDSLKILTIRATAFSSTILSSLNIPVTYIDTVFDHPATTFVNEALIKTERPDLSNAKIIISGGRGLKSAENFKILEQLADLLGAAVGASRAAVDAGFAPNDYQIGQTGKIVAPELYIAIGISGAIQHLAGMKESKIIVAINNDPAAPIFEIANYGLVGDLFKILPELYTELSKCS